jgi:hypothetical protein
MTAEVSTVGVDRHALARAWGISWPWWPDWPWTTRIRILIVTDGRVTDGSTADEFGLGPVLDTLRDASFAYWVRFIVRLVNRDEGFRFTDPAFDIDRYDQIWFFGDWPGLDANDPSFPDSRIEDADYSPMEDGELALIAAWMNNGGGVFATGDHALLGASMCHKIPRVRSMRKWTHAQGVPSFANRDRHETLQGRPTIGAAAAEGDRYPQRIYPVLRADSRWPFVFGSWPHPLLCGRAGVIDEFPDHMHEGAVVDDDDLVLTDKLLPGSTADEYPVIPVVIASDAANAAIAGPPIDDESTLVNRPRPRVVAYGMTTNLESVPRRFALLGAYDGDPVGVGRVVVDSTWHHWFSMNLLGLRDEAPGFYRNMQQYYRNVGLWLATPAQRASMLMWATWGAVTGTQPGLLDPALGIFGMGERVLDVIGRTAPQCIVSEVVEAFLDDGSAQARATIEDETPWDRVARPPADMVNQAIVGGMAIGMFGLSKRHINERARGRIARISPEEIRDAGMEGLELGRRELRAAFHATATRFEALAEPPAAERHRHLAERIDVGSRMDDDESDDETR